MPRQVLVVRHGKAHDIQWPEMTHHMQHHLRRQPQEREESGDLGLCCDVDDTRTAESRGQAVGVEEWVVGEGEVNEGLRREEVDDVED